MTSAELCEAKQINKELLEMHSSMSKDLKIVLPKLYDEIVCLRQHLCCWIALENYEETK